MEVQEVEIIIGKDGQVQVQVRGVQGKACLILTEGLEEALGSEILLREMTSDANAVDNPLDQPLHLKSD
jgi:hypothetical protein